MQLRSGVPPWSEIDVLGHLVETFFAGHVLYVYTRLWDIYALQGHTKRFDVLDQACSENQQPVALGQTVSGYNLIELCFFFLAPLDASCVMSAHGQAVSEDVLLQLFVFLCFV